MVVPLVVVYQRVTRACSFNTLCYHMDHQMIQEMVLITMLQILIIIVLDISFTGVSTFTAACSTKWRTTSAFAPHVSLNRPSQNQYLSIS
jgi:hypothetical protein